VAVSFFASLVPIVGNLASNTAIVVATLTQSIGVAAGSLAFLIGVHKLEYFLNAHFVGNRVRLPVYVLLTAMLMCEAALGAGGLVAAPVLAAWVARELRATGWL
jgi:predicted PurR-regulated permease PerM